jgi:hypothetical protein
LKTADEKQLPEYLKNIAEQLNSSESEANTTRKVFGDKISDIALKLYPDARPEPINTPTELRGTEEGNKKNEPEGVGEVDNGLQVDNRGSGEGIGDKEGVEPIKETFENKTQLEDNLDNTYKGQKNVVYHGSPDISYLKDVSDLNTKDNTQNAESKYVWVNPKSKYALNYSKSHDGFHENSGVAAFELGNGKKYVLKKSDISELRTNEDYEKFFDNKKQQGYDYVEVPQDGGNIVVLNNDILTLKGKHLNSEVLKPKQQPSSNTLSGIRGSGEGIGDKEGVVNPTKIDDIGEGFELHRGGKGEDGFFALDKDSALGYADGNKENVTSGKIKKGVNVLKLVEGDTDNYDASEVGVKKFYEIIGNKERGKNTSSDDPSDITEVLWDNPKAVEKLKKAGVDIVVGNSMDGVTTFVVNKDAIEKPTKEQPSSNTLSGIRAGVGDKEGVGRKRDIVPVEKKDAYLELNGIKIYELPQIDDLLSNDDGWAFAKSKKKLKENLEDEMQGLNEASPEYEQAKWLLSKMDDIAEHKSSFAELHDDKSKAILSDFRSGELGKITEQVDNSIGGEVGDAIDKWIGMKKADVTNGALVGGIFNEKPLEELYLKNPSEIERAFNPIKEYLRSKYGDNISLYRSEDINFKDREKRHLLSYTSNPIAVKQFYREGKTNLYREQVPIDDIVAITNRFGQHEFIVKAEPTKQPSSNTLSGIKENKTDEAIPDKVQNEKVEGLFKKAAAVQDLTSPRERVLQHFANGGKIHTSSVEQIFGNGVKSTEGERRSRIDLLRKDAPTIEQLAHQLWESDPTGKFNTSDYKNAIEQVVSDHKSRASTAKELIGVREAAKHELNSNELKNIDDKQLEQLHKIVQGLPDNQKQELTKLLETYQNEYGLVDWDRLEKDSNGFEPKILNLSEETQKSLYDLIEKNNNPQSGSESTNANGENILQAEGQKERQQTENQQEPPIEPPKEKELVKEVEDGSVGIRHEDTAGIRQQYGLGDYEKIPETFEKWDKEAAERIDKGEMPNVIKKLEAKDPIDPVEQRMMGKYIATLKSAFDNNQSDENFSALKKAVELSDAIGGSEVGKSLVARKGTFLPEDSLAAFMLKEAETNHVETLTDAQKEKVKQEHEQIQKKQSDFDEYVKKKEAELSDREAKLSIEEEKKASRTSSKAKKSHDDYVKERQDAVAKAKEALKKIRTGESGLSAVPLPGVRELMAIAPHVKDVMKSYVSEGIGKLEDIIDRLHDDFKDTVDGLTKEHIRDIIAGAYNKKLPEKKDLAKQVFELGREAKWLKKLEEAYNAPEKTEKQKVEKNQRIAEIKKQIKDIKAIEAEKNAPQKAIESAKKKIQKQLDEVNEQLRTGNFEKKPPKPKVQLDEQGKKLLNALVKARQQRDIRLMQIQYAQRSRYQKAVDAVLEVLNVPRTIMSSTDFSAPLRQGLFAFVSHPVTGIRATKEMFNFAFSQQRFDNWFHQLKDSPRYDLMMNSELSLSDPHDYRLTAKEEAFMNNLAEKIPLIGKTLIKGSERAYVGFLNKMRVDLFNRYADYFEEQGRTYDNSPELYKALGKYIGDATGRGSMGKIEAYAPIFNSVLFSPRLIASRLNLMSNWANPHWYKNTPKPLRMMYFKDMAKFIGFGLSILTLAKLGGADVEDDPRSSDFGKIRSGNTRWDIWGGFQQYARLFTQIATGEKKSATSNIVSPITGQGRFGETRGDVIERFFRGKLAPVPSMIWDFAKGRTVTGDKTDSGDDELNVGSTQPFNFPYGKEVENHFLPLIFSDMKEAMQDKGISSIFTVGIPATFGVGIQTFNPKPPSNTGGGAGAKGNFNKSAKSSHKSKSKAK